MQILEMVPRVRRARAMLPELEARERWPRERIDDFQLQRVNALWAHAIDHVPYYRALQRELDLPPAFDSIDDYRAAVPILRKDTLRARHGEFLSERRSRGTWHPTSGSTGRPLEFFWSHRDHQEVLRARYRFYGSWGVDILDRSAFVWGGGERGGWRGRIDRIGERVNDRLRHRLRLSAAELSERGLLADLGRIERHGTEMLYGFTQAIHVLARAALESGFRCPSLKVVVVTGEVARPSTLEVIERAFGVPAVVEYGSTECHLLAGTAADGTLRVREDVVLLETEPRDDGRYDILLSPLANRSFPLLRYDIEDVTDAPLDRSDAGFAALANLAGRDDDVLITSRGAPVHSSAIDAIFEERTDSFRRYRVHQRSDGTVHVEVEIGTAEAGERDAVLHELQQIVGDYSVRMEAVDAIATSPAGKHRVVTSDLAPTP